MYLMPFYDLENDVKIIYSMPVFDESDTDLYFSMKLFLCTLRIQTLVTFCSHYNNILNQFILVLKSSW